MLCMSVAALDCMFCCVHSQYEAEETHHTPCCQGWHAHAHHNHHNRHNRACALACPTPQHCVTLHWPASWLPTRGYTSFTLGFENACDAVDWHRALQRALCALRVRGGGASSGSTKGEGAPSSAGAHSSKPSYDDRSLQWSGGGAVARKHSQDKGFVAAALEHWLGSREDTAGGTDDGGAWLDHAHCHAYAHARHRPHAHARHFVCGCCDCSTLLHCMKMLWGAGSSAALVRRALPHQRCMRGGLIALPITVLLLLLRRGRVVPHANQPCADSHATSAEQWLRHRARQRRCRRWQSPCTQQRGWQWRHGAEPPGGHLRGRQLHS
jgi:hypothetical protein